MEDGAGDGFELGDFTDGGGEGSESSDSSGASVGLGIRGAPVSLGERTLSRERLVGMEGRRSRRGSPKRGRMGLGRVRED